MADMLDRFMIGLASAGELTLDEPYLHQPGHGLIDRGVQGGVCLASASPWDTPR